jgi:hypothetical protein
MTIDIVEMCLYQIFIGSHFIAGGWPSNESTLYDSSNRKQANKIVIEPMG